MSDKMPGPPQSGGASYRRLPAHAGEQQGQRMNEKTKIDVRMKPAEVAKIVAAAKREGMKPSAFMREAALTAADRRAMLTPEEIEALHYAVRAMNGTGNLLNQLVRALHVWIDRGDSRRLPMPEEVTDLLQIVRVDLERLEAVLAGEAPLRE